ncbi:MAG: pantetheine-phosphate adenylyltransferase [Oscillospiraceae bacterium]|nr:pantetheine-phosphate adenylyltransferase [Oscillospiraceae bacterium]
MKRAIYPGSFDPVTLGHLNIIKRAAAMFDELIVLVSVNSSKNSGMFSPDERVELLRKVTDSIPNVKVDCCYELVADYARQNRAKVLVKGLRAVSDYESEIQLAMVNSKLYSKLDTIFLYTSPKYAYLSSTVVKEMARYGADLSDFVPRQIIGDIETRAHAIHGKKEK